MKIELFEGRRAEDYDRNIPLIFPGYFDAMQKADELLTERLGKELSAKILVPGCGTGTEMDYLLKNHPHWHLTGVDPSPEMTEIANYKLSQYPPSSYGLKNSLLSSIPQEEKFDAVMLHLVLHFLPDNGDKLLLLRQIAARMKPSSPFILVDISGDETQLKTEIAGIENHLIEKNISAIKIEKLTMHIRKDIHPCTQERMQVLLKEAGFHNCKVFYKQYMYAGWISECR